MSRRPASTWSGCNSRTLPRSQPRSSDMSRRARRIPAPPLDPTLVDASQRQREALLGAVANEAERWPEEDQKIAAAMFDVLWSVESYERLVVDWQIDHERAVEGR